MTKIPNPTPEWVKRVFEEAREQVSKWPKAKQKWASDKMLETFNTEKENITMAFDQFLLEKFEQVLEKDLQGKTTQESLRIINDYITSLEGMRKRIGDNFIKELRDSNNGR